MAAGLTRRGLAAWTVGTTLGQHRLAQRREAD
jgi:hypothetical protein